MLTNLPPESRARHKLLSRAAFALMAAADTPEEKAAKALAHNTDALARENHSRKVGHAPIDIESIADLVPAPDNEGTVNELTSELLAVDGAISTDEEPVEDESELWPAERKVEAHKRAQARKAQAKLEGDRLSAHRLEALEATCRFAVNTATSDKDRAFALAYRHKAETLIGRSKFAERRAAETGESVSTIKREIREGQNLWANLLQVALGLKIEPDSAIEYLASLPRSVQLRVAQVAEQLRGEWDVQEEIEKHKRAKKLSHGILNKLPAPQLCDEETRLRLSTMTEQAQMKEVAAMRNAEKAKLQKASDLNDRRDFKFATLSTEAGSLLVKMFTSATAADREYFKSVMSLGFIHATQEA